MTPSNFTSFMDYLDLNEESFRELEDSAAARAAQADEAAQMALGSAYQQASRDAQTGGQGQLSAQTSYLDFVRAKREADAAAALPTTGMSPAELAARQAMRGETGGPARVDFDAQQERMRGQLTRETTGLEAAKRTQEEARKRAEAERDEQRRGFDEAKGKVMADLEGRLRRANYYGSQQSSPVEDRRAMREAGQAGFSSLGTPGATNGGAGNGYRGQLSQRLRAIRGYGGK